MKKNVAEQYVAFYFIDSTTDEGKTGDAANITAYVSLDGAAESAATNAVSELDATNCPGVYLLELDATETNADTVVVFAKSGTANIECKTLHTIHPTHWTFDTADWDDIVRACMAVVLGVAVKTSTGVEFKKRDGTTTTVTIAHDTLGNRTSSVIT
jgi:hypothetical protein